MKERPAVPHMALPLRVGIAFVPETKDDRNRSRPLDEAARRKLLEDVADHFKDLPFVSGIEIIPSTYLTPGGGFRNLDQIAAMHDIEAVALVAFDQIQHSDETLLSISYLTIVGSYVIPGEKNDTSTMLDTAVYHIPSRKMLFRAPGTSSVKGRATPINVVEHLRKNSAEGFAKANEQMIANLDAELERFKVRVKEQPEQFVVSHKPGYRGGGGFGPTLAAALLAALALSRRKASA